MGQQQGKERGSGGGGSIGGLGGPGSSIASVAGGSTVDRHVGSSIRNKSSSAASSKPKAATVSQAATSSGKERGILGSNIFTEHSGKFVLRRGKQRENCGERGQFTEPNSMAGGGVGEPTPAAAVSEGASAREKESNRGGQEMEEIVVVCDMGWVGDNFPPAAVLQSSSFELLAMH